VELFVDDVKSLSFLEISRRIHLTIKNGKGGNPD
jgi:hypothetical protein